MAEDGYDFGAGDEGLGPVDPQTEMRMQGAIQRERGFARAFAAGGDPSVQQAYAQSGAVKGALAAKNIRDRYFKKEWEQIQQVEIAPIQAELKQAQELRSQKLQMTTLPVSRAFGQLEGQDRAASETASNASLLSAMPNAAPKKGETASAEPGMLPVPNPALAGGNTVGGVEIEEALALIDPLSGAPVKVDSPRGEVIMREAERDFWGSYSNVSTKLLDTLAKYKGNPFVSSAINNIIAHTEKFAGTSVTGKSDPAEASAHWQERQAWEADMQIKQQSSQRESLALEREVPQVEAEVADARRMVSSESGFADLLGNDLSSKLGDPNQKLTRQEQLKIAAIRNMHRDLQEKDIAAAGRAGIVRIPPQLIDKKETWQNYYLENDPLYKLEYSTAIADATNEKIMEFVSMDPVELGALLKDKGASQEMITAAVAGHWKDEKLNEFMTGLASTSEVREKANGIAYIKRLEDNSQRQPELQNMIKEDTEEAIRRATEKFGDQPEIYASMRAHPIETFYTYTTGNEAPKVDSYRYRREQKQYEDQRDIRQEVQQKKERARTTLFQQEREAVGAPTGSERLRVLDQSPITDPSSKYPVYSPETRQAAPEQIPTLDAPYQSPSYLRPPPPEVQAPMSSSLSGSAAATTTGAATEWERVYGGENPLTTISNKLMRPRTAFEREYGGRTFGSQPQDVEGNPYLSLTPQVLQQILQSLPANSQAIPLIEEAIAAQNPEFSTRFQVNR